MRSFLLTLLIFSMAIFVGCSKSQVEGLPSTDGGVVIELDGDGNEIWRTYKFEIPVSYYRDEEGNQYVADAKNSQFVVYDKEGKLMQKFPAISPQVISLTPDKNVLMVSKAGEQNIIEINKEGQVVWSLKSKPGITDAVKLINGNYMLASEKEDSIIEIDKDAKEVWKTPENVFNAPRKFQLLPDGRFIVADFNNHRVIELDKNMAAGWDYNENLNHPTAVVRLDSGKHLISDYDNSRILVMDFDKNIVKEIPGIKALNITVLPNGNAAVAGTVKK